MGTGEKTGCSVLDGQVSEKFSGGCLVKSSTGKVNCPDQLVLCFYLTRVYVVEDFECRKVGEG